MVGTVPPDTGGHTFPSVLSTGRGQDAACETAGSRRDGSPPLAILPWVVVGHEPCGMKVTPRPPQGSSLGEQSPQASVTPRLDSYLRDECVSNESLPRSEAHFSAAAAEPARHVLGTRAQAGRGLWASGGCRRVCRRRAMVQEDAYQERCTVGGPARLNPSLPLASVAADGSERASRPFREKRGS